MDTNIKHIEFDKCTSIIKKNLQVVLSDDGKLLDISICLKNVCPCRKLMVGVLVYYNNKPYALKTKEINTDKACKCCHCCCYLKDICVEGFEFLFPSTICKHEIIIKVIAHYIC